MCMVETRVWIGILCWLSDSIVLKLNHKSSLKKMCLERDGGKNCLYGSALRGYHPRLPKSLIRINSIDADVALTTSYG